MVTFAKKKMPTEETIVLKVGVPVVTTRKLTVHGGTDGNNERNTIPTCTLGEVIGFVLREAGTPKSPPLGFRVVRTAADTKLVLALEGECRLYPQVRFTLKGGHTVVKVVYPEEDTADDRRGTTFYRHLQLSLRVSFATKIHG
jgi:hypothetical protein